MEPRVSLSILALLLGFSQALPVMQPKNGDISSNILSTNKGSNEQLMEGDILLTRTKNAMLCPNHCFWKKSLKGLVEVPFVVSSEFSPSEKTVIANAMETFHNKTCIYFVHRTNQTDYISIENRDGCYSFLGRIGGLQVISLSRQGCVYQGVIQHELNHALGFYHEHTRSDRDNYVMINWQNIDPAGQPNFNKRTTNNLNTPYDYSSVMHYGRTAFSINGHETISPIANPTVQIGQRQELSNTDIMRINILYMC